MNRSISMVALGATLALVQVGVAGAQQSMQCFSTEPQALIKLQPIYTGAAAQYVQSAYVPATAGRWSEHESLAMRAKWSEASRIPTAAELNQVQPAAGSPPTQPVIAAVPTAVLKPVAPAVEPAPVTVAPLGATGHPGTNPDSNAPPGAVGCANERIDQTTADSARRAIEAVGFSQVRNLRKGCDNVWHAHAQLNNKLSYVALNPQGDIYIEKNP